MATSKKRRRAPSKLRTKPKAQTKRSAIPHGGVTKCVDAFGGGDLSVEGGIPTGQALAVQSAGAGVRFCDRKTLLAVSHEARLVFGEFRRLLGAFRKGECSELDLVKCRGRVALQSRWLHQHAIAAGAEPSTLVALLQAEVIRDGSADANINAAMVVLEALMHNPKLGTVGTVDTTSTKSEADRLEAAHYGLTGTEVEIARNCGIPTEQYVRSKLDPDGTRSPAAMDAVYAEYMRERGRERSKPPTAELSSALLQAAGPDGDETDEKRPKCSHSPDFTSVTWYARSFRFTKTQAAVIGLLWSAWEKNDPTLGEGAISEAIYVDRDSPRRFSIRDLFRFKVKVEKPPKSPRFQNRPHPAMDFMVHRTGKGVWTLGPPKNEKFS